jgi:hypothetical protein
MWQKLELKQLCWKVMFESLSNGRTPLHMAAVLDCWYASAGVIIRSSNEDGGKKGPLDGELYQYERCRHKIGGSCNVAMSAGGRAQKTLSEGSEITP